MAWDYYKMIKALFGFRDKLDEVSNVKFEKLIEYLKKGEVNSRDEEQVYPDTTEIANSIGLPRHKITVLIRELYFNLIDHFMDNSLTLKESIQVIYIHFPYDEEHTIHKGYREEAKRMSLWFQVQLPIIPRLGEEISLDFIESDFKYYHGHVVEISHDISCFRQRTIIHVHPLKNYFHQWEKFRALHELELRNKGKI